MELSFSFEQELQQNSVTLDWIKPANDGRAISIAATYQGKCARSTQSQSVNKSTNIEDNVKKPQRLVRYCKTILQLHQTLTWQLVVIQSRDNQLFPVVELSNSKINTISENAYNNICFSLIIILKIPALEINLAIQMPNNRLLESHCDIVKEQGHKADSILGPRTKAFLGPDVIDGSRKKRPEGWSTSFTNCDKLQQLTIGNHFDYYI
ncbi:hypothetical protein J6590_038580 [Homalodisca vitripennis]|nr:hypothetical protein J6590_038580 [Homalodisca vitripennis]